jgi:hypothetical protein
MNRKLVPKAPASYAVLLVVLLCPLVMTAQGDDSEGFHPSMIASNNNAGESGKVNDRIFGVLPNYRTIDGSIPFRPMTSPQKLGMAAKDTFDWPTFIVTGGFASIYQAEKQNPAFGQGLQGYAKRYASALGDQVIGNMMTEGFLPVLLHQDPRFFRSGTGTTGSRLKSTLLQMVMARTDSGAWRFNTAEWLGNGIAVGISNTYYKDARTLPDNMQRFSMQIGNDALSDVLKEFWPDIKHRFFEHHRTPPNEGKKKGREALIMKAWARPTA